MSKEAAAATSCASWTTTSNAVLQAQHLLHHVNSLYPPTLNLAPACHPARLHSARPHLASLHHSLQASQLLLKRNIPLPLLCLVIRLGTCTGTGSSPTKQASARCPATCCLPEKASSGIASAQSSCQLALADRSPPLQEVAACQPTPQPTPKHTSNTASLAPHQTAAHICKQGTQATGKCLSTGSWQNMTQRLSTLCRRGGVKHRNGIQPAAKQACTHVGALGQATAATGRVPSPLLTLRTRQQTHLSGQ